MHLFTHFASPNTVLGFSSDPAPAKSQHSIGGNKNNDKVRSFNFLYDFVSPDTVLGFSGAFFV